MRLTTLLTDPESERAYQGSAWGQERLLLLLFYPTRKGEMVKFATGMISNMQFSGETYLDIQDVTVTVGQRLQR